MVGGNSDIGGQIEPLCGGGGGGVDVIVFVIVVVVIVVVVHLLTFHSQNREFVIHQ